MMNIFRLRLLTFVSAFFLASAASATTINFIEMADGSVWGESGYSTLTVGDMSITGTKNGQSAFAYLDRSIAGLGVCTLVNNTGKKGNSGSNQCSSGAGDDNITTGEALQFVFGTDVLVTNIWFNNNHDGGFVSGDLINIEGAAVNALTGYADGDNGFGSWAISAGDSFDVFFNNEQFYVSAISYQSVPEPLSMALLGLGLLGLSAARRRQS